jgi:hypothetical protein
MSLKIKEFDAVQLMRKLRDQMSEEMAPLSPEERIIYIRRKTEENPLYTLFSQKTRTGKAEPVVRGDG